MPGKFKTETIGMASMQNIGLGKMTNVGMAYTRTVGMMMISKVGTSRTDTVGKNQTARVGNIYELVVGSSTAQGETATHAMNVVAPTGAEANKESAGSSIRMDKDTIVLQVGPSKVVVTPHGIFLDAPGIHLKAASTVNVDAPDDVHLNSGTALPAPAFETGDDGSEQ